MKRGDDGWACLLDATVVKLDVLLREIHHSMTHAPAVKILRRAPSLGWRKLGGRSKRDEVFACFR